MIIKFWSIKRAKWQKAFIPSESLIRSLVFQYLCWRKSLLCYGLFPQISCRFWHHRIMEMIAACFLTLEKHSMIVKQRLLSFSANMEVLLFQMFKVLMCRKYCHNSSLMILDILLPFEGRELPGTRWKDRKDSCVSKA